MQRMESDKDKLRKAVKENDDDAINNLLSSGVKVDKDIVAMAAAKGIVAVIKKYLEQGGDPNDSQMLDRAVKNDQQKVVHLLVSAGVTVHKETAGHAAAHAMEEVVRAFLDQGGDTNVILGEDQAGKKANLFSEALAGGHCDML